MKPITWKSPMKAELLALALALAASPIQAEEHGHAIEAAQMTQAVSRIPTPTTKTRRPKLNVVFTPQSNSSWYLGTSPVHLVNSGSKMGSVFAAGYSGKVGASLQYELRLSRESSTSTRLQLAVKF
jgi:hypothetical protein